MTERVVVYNERDPDIGIVLSQQPNTGWYGTCTGCGWPTFRWHRDKAVAGAQAHVDDHDA